MRTLLLLTIAYFMVGLTSEAALAHEGGQFALTSASTSFSSLAVPNPVPSKLYIEYFDFRWQYVRPHDPFPLQEWLTSAALGKVDNKFRVLNDPSEITFMLNLFHGAPGTKSKGNGDIRLLIETPDKSFYMYVTTDGNIATSSGQYQMSKSNLIHLISKLHSLYRAPSNPSHPLQSH